MRKNHRAYGTYINTDYIYGDIEFNTQELTKNTETERRPKLVSQNRYKKAELNKPVLDKI